MSELEARFKQAAEDVRQRPQPPHHDTLLKLHALYRQAIDGDACGPKPGYFDFVGTARHEAWAELKGMSRDEAQRRYIDLATRLDA